MKIQILISVLLSAKASASAFCPKIDSGALFKSCFVCQQATYLKTVQLRVKAACFILDRHQCCKIFEVKKPERFHKSSRASFTVSNRVHLIWKTNFWLKDWPLHHLSFRTAQRKKLVEKIGHQRKFLGSNYSIVRDRSRFSLKKTLIVMMSQFHNHERVHNSNWPNCVN